ncbi:hypothetical protein BTHI11S_05676 [Bosea thiooxidans]
MVTTEPAHFPRIAAASPITRSVGSSSSTTVVPCPNRTVLPRVSPSSWFWQLAGGSATQPVSRRPIETSALKPCGKPLVALVWISLLISSRQVRPRSLTRSSSTEAVPRSSRSRSARTARAAAPKTGPLRSTRPSARRALQSSGTGAGDTAAGFAVSAGAAGAGGGTAGAGAVQAKRAPAQAEHRRAQAARPAARRAGSGPASPATARRPGPAEAAAAGTRSRPARRSRARPSAQSAGAAPGRRRSRPGPFPDRE